MEPHVGEQAVGGRRNDAAADADRGPLFDASFPASEAELAPIRHRLRAWLLAHPLTVEERGDLLLVASELLTNAVESSPGPTSVVRLQVRLDEPGRPSGPDGRPGLAQDGCIELRVTDEGPGFDLPLYEPVPPTQLRGRGLLLARSLTDGVHIELGAGVGAGGSGGTTVVAHRWLAPRDASVAAS